MNNRIGIKICGMRDPENILQVAELCPDYMGFIFYPKSKRYVGMDFKIPKELGKSIKRVGVCVNETTSRMMELANTHQLDFMQLHGNETVQQCLELKGRGLRVTKVFSIDNHFDFRTVYPYKKAVDYVLFDTKSEGYGGSGKAFDWNLLRKYDQEVPFFLSGGLSVENIKGVNALKGMNLCALDVNSGVEVSPGLKDINKITEVKNIFISNPDL